MNYKYILISALLVSVLLTSNVSASYEPSWSYHCDGTNLVESANFTINGSISNETFAVKNTISNQCDVMTEEIYITFEAMAVLFMIIGIIRKEEETVEAALIFPALSTILFLMLAILGGTINMIPNTAAMMINLGLGFVNLIHLIYIVFYSSAKAIGVNLEGSRPDKEYEEGFD